MYFRILILFAAFISAFQIDQRQSPSVFLFAFGDSYTTIGFNIYGTQPSAGNPLGNPALGTGTSSGGLNYIEYLTTQYNNGLVQTYNFAYGGATITDSIVPTADPSFHTFEQQVEQYYEPKYQFQSSAAAPWSSNDAIFLSFFGINDLGQTYYSTNLNGEIAALVNFYIALIANLYATGARKFLIIDVPPVDRSPFTLYTPGANQADYANAIAEFNVQLAYAAEAWLESNPDAGLVFFDFNQWMTGILDNPNAYGFQDATCAGDAYGNCIWWSGSNLHISSTFHNLLAQELVGYLQELGW